MGGIFRCHNSLHTSLACDASHGVMMLPSSNYNKPLPTWLKNATLDTTNVKREGSSEKKPSWERRSRESILTFRYGIICSRGMLTQAAEKVLMCSQVAESGSIYGGLASWSGSDWSRFNQTGSGCSGSFSNRSTTNLSLSKCFVCMLRIHTANHQS